MSAREAALQTLVAMDHQKAWSNGHLKKVIQEAHLDRRDAALATRLCFECCKTGCCWTTTSSSTPP